MLERKTDERYESKIVCFEELVREHEVQFAYESHTACDERGFVLGYEVQREIYMTA